MFLLMRLECLQLLVVRSYKQYLFCCLDGLYTFQLFPRFHRILLLSVSMMSFAPEVFERDRKLGPRKKWVDHFVYQNSQQHFCFLLNDVKNMIIYGIIILHPEIFDPWLT